MKKHLLQPENWSKSRLSERFLLIEPFVANRSVLDFGCATGFHRSDWMHKLIRSRAKTLKGIDIDEKNMGEMRKSGYDVEYGDVQNYDPHAKYEVVHAGEILEHLDNFAGFFQSVKNSLLPGGMLVMTVPNAFCYSNFIYRLWGDVRFHSDHNCWFCEKTISNLLIKHGFEITQLNYVPHKTPGFIRNIFANILRSLLPDRLRWRSILVVAYIKDD